MRRHDSPRLAPPAEAPASYLPETAPADGEATVIKEGPDLRELIDMAAKKAYKAAQRRRENPVETNEVGSSMFLLFNFAVGLELLA